MTHSGPLNKKPQKRTLPIIILLLIFGLMFPPQMTSAAKAPSAVECELHFSGDQFSILADLLDLGPSDSNLEFELSDFNSWAVYLLKQDTPEKLWNSNNQPKRFNTVRFSQESGIPQVSMGPYWLDMGTALPHSRPGVYEFSSDPISETANYTGPAAKLIRKLRNSSEWQTAVEKKNGRVAYRKKFESEGGSSLSITIYETEFYQSNRASWGYAVYFSSEKTKRCRPTL